MTEVLSLFLLVGIAVAVGGTLGLSTGGSYGWRASETDPFEGRHIHVVSTQADIDRLPCPEPTCYYHGVRP